MNVDLPFLLQRLDKSIQDNKGYFVNGKLSWPDLQYTAMYEYLCVMAGREIDEEYSNLRNLRKKVSEIPQIQKWIEKRPKSEW